MDSRDDSLRKTELGRLIAADKVQGTPVANPAGERIGEIENVMIDKPTGQVAYAVMSFGGLFGFGKGRYPLPWELPEYDTELDSFVVDLDPDALQGAPVYRDGATDWSDDAWNRKIHDQSKPVPVELPDRTPPAELPPGPAELPPAPGPEELPGDSPPESPPPPDTPPTEIPPPAADTPPGDPDFWPAELDPRRHPAGRRHPIEQERGRPRDTGRSGA